MGMSISLKLLTKFQFPWDLRDGLLVATVNTPANNV